jgi:hypothetical protein
VSPGRLRELVRTGQVNRVLRGAYAPADLGDVQTTRAAAARLVLAPHVVVADLGAAWLHGVDCYEPGDLDVSPGLHVVSVDGHDRSRRPELVGGRRALLPEDIMTLHGIRLTTPLRTACDIACLRGRSRALAALDAFARAFDLTAEDFATMLPRYRGRRGCRQLRDLLPHVTPGAESPGESWTRLAIIDAGLPVPAPQRWLLVPGYGNARLDLAYEHLKIAVEYDGEEFHDEDRRHHDERRRAALRRAGWHVIVVRKADLSGVSLDAWLDELRAELALRRTSAVRRYARGPLA